LCEANASPVSAWQTPFNSLYVCKYYLQCVFLLATEQEQKEEKKTRKGSMQEKDLSFLTTFFSFFSFFVLFFICLCFLSFYKNDDEIHDECCRYCRRFDDDGDRKYCIRLDSQLSSSFEQDDRFFLLVF
jgi:hypothetical protein